MAAIGRRRVMVVGGGGGRGSSAAPFGARLVQPGAIAGGGLVTFTRSQVGATAGAISSAGGGTWWTEYAADVPRFVGAANRLLLDGQRTNISTRSRLVGGTGWTLTDVSATPTTGPDGVSGTANILDEGTNTAAHWVAPATVTFTAGVTYSFSAIVKAGTCTSCQLFSTTPAFSGTAFQNYNLATGALGTSGAGSLTPRIVPLGDGWYWISMSAVAGSTGSSRPLALGMTSSPSAASRLESYTGTNRTMLAFWGWAEEAPFPSSPILAATEPSTSTRGQDSLISAISSLFPSGVGTVLGSFVLPFSAVGADQTLFDINDGSTNNRIRLRNVAGGATLVAGQVIGGTPADATTIGSMTPGTLFRVGLTFDGSTITANFNGGSNQTVAGQPSGLTTLRVGNNSAGTAPMFGECGYFDALPYVIPGANLPAAVSAIP